MTDDHASPDPDVDAFGRIHAPHHEERSGNDVDWDERYSTTEQMWSGAPNGSLVREVAGLDSGTALDVGCGEGADAIWLASLG